MNLLKRLQDLYMAAWRTVFMGASRKDKPPPAGEPPRKGH